MRLSLVVVAILALTPVACAQPYYAGPAGEDFWRERHEAEMRRRVEYAGEQRHEEWLREHCGRDWQGEVVCRR